MDGSVYKIIELVGTSSVSWEEILAAQPVAERQSPAAVASYLVAKQSERHQLLTTFGEAWAYFSRPLLRRNLALAVSVL